MANKKIELGQFFTKGDLWLKPQIKEFIKNSKCEIAFDPFAGSGDLLKSAKIGLNFSKTFGLDIDENLNWKINDSLICIPKIKNSIIITNPPYIAKQSASRKKINLSKYFNSTVYDDIYLLALDKMLESSKNLVAIIPESFINSNYRQKNLLSSITILEENPFEDTKNPVCVACFDGKAKSFSEIKIYKNENLISDLEKIKQLRIVPKRNLKIVFNDKSGWLALRAVDSADDVHFINFDFKENIKYDWEHKINVNSRLFSLINIDMPNLKKQVFISDCNKILNKLRKDSSDILLTPFKGNTKKGMRRRRLDFRLARAIMEKAYLSTEKKSLEK